MSWWSSATRIQTPEFDISHSIVRQTMQSGTPLILTNAQEDERFREQQSVMSLSLRSVLCLPFKIRDRVLGAIYEGLLARYLAEQLSAGSPLGIARLLEAREKPAVKRFRFGRYRE